MKHSVNLIQTNILPQVKPKHKSLFQFGLQAFSLTAFSSLNSNARSIIENVNTASSKVYRLVSNEGILSDFNSILKSSNLVGDRSLVNVDFSTFCGFETLSLATQTQSGRAIPVWANCITYPIKEVGSQNKFVFEQIESFALCLGFYPKFVFDRGFWIPDLMKFFLNGHISFYLRIKKGQKLEWKTSKKSKAIIIGKYTKDVIITLFEHKLRLVVSPLPKKAKERWYIITNDLDSDRETVLNIYAHRFEIEETFKDLKHVMKLKRIFIQKKQTFRILLLFNCLSFWLSFWCQQHLVIGVGYLKAKINPRKKRSYFKVWWEGIQMELRRQSLLKMQKVWSG